MHILVSGLIGALLATLFSLLYNHISEQVKLRIDFMMATVEWLDNIYTRLQTMQVHKERVYTNKAPSLSEEEYRIISNEVRTLLLSEKIKTQVTLIYGEGDKLQRINTLQGELLKVAQLLWAADKDTWDESSKKIMESFNKIIDPIKAIAMKDFLVSARKVTMFKNFLRGSLSMFLNFPSKIRNQKIVIDTFELRTFVQVTAITSALISSFFLVKGTFILSVIDLVQLSLTKWNYNLDVLKNLTSSRADSIIGFYLLMLSFILQSVNLTWPMRIGDFKIDRKGALSGLIFSLLVFIAANNLSILLEEQYFKEAQKLIKNEIHHLKKVEGASPL